MKHHETLVIRCDDICARCRDVGARCGDVCVWHGDVGDHTRFDATISALDAETSALNAETSGIVRSYRRHQCGVFGDCAVGVTPQMCNRVPNHIDTSTFYRPASIPLKINRVYTLSCRTGSALVWHSEGRICG